MIPYQLDPTLHPAQPAPPRLDDGCSPPGASAVPPQLDDGCSPPAAKAASPADPDAGDAAPVDPSLWAKSEF